jgi:hypothetical protein
MKDLAEELHAALATNYMDIFDRGSRSQWLRCLRRRSAAAWLLGSRVRIPLRAWMFVSCLYVVLSCDGLIACPEES